MWTCKMGVYYGHSFYKMTSWQGDLHIIESAKSFTHYLRDNSLTQSLEML